MKKTKRLKLNLSQTLTHYGIVIFLLFIVSLTVKSLIEIYFTNTYTGVRTSEELINSSLPFLLFAILFAFIQYRRLNFKEFKTNFTEEQFLEALKRTETELEWRISKNNKIIFIAYRPNWTGIWGELVTIIKENDKILINSICDPNRFSSVVSYGMNRKNIQTFLKNLSEVLSDKPAEIKIEKVTSEWSAKRIAIRLLAYPFCVFLIVLGAYMVFQPLTIKTILAGFGAITIASFYLYTDIKILTTGKDKSPNR